jgi:hypothetical protein
VCIKKLLDLPIPKPFMSYENVQFIDKGDKKCTYGWVGRPELPFFLSHL